MAAAGDPQLIDRVSSPGRRAALLIVAWTAGVVAALKIVYLPLLRSRYFRRRAVEAAADPRAAKLLRWERRFWVGGMILGTATGAIALARAAYLILS